MKLDFEEMTAKAKENVARKDEEAKRNLERLSDRYKARQNVVKELMHLALVQEHEKADAAALAEADKKAAEARSDYLREYERETGHAVKEESKAKVAALRELSRLLDKKV